jgi:hypothetical protein
VVVWIPSAVVPTGAPPSFEYDHSLVGDADEQQSRQQFERKWRRSVEAVENVLAGGAAGAR